MNAGRILLVTLLCANLCFGQDVSTIKLIRNCLSQENSLMCLKEQALDVVNETIYSDKPMTLFGSIEIFKDPAYIKQHNETDVLPLDSRERSIKINNLLYDKIMELLQSRSVKFNLAKVFEGRGKKGGKKGGMMLMGGLAMAGMVAQMFMGKMMMMSGAALIMAKIALMISIIIGIKKMGGGGGGGGGDGGGHVVYSNGGGYGHDGGWHRSINHVDGDAQNIAYRGHSHTSDQPTFSF